VEIRNPEETNRELRVLLTDAVGRSLTPIETEILNDIVAYPDEKRIAYLQLMKELINKQKTVI
jgi:hypothetical protein